MKIVSWFGVMDVMVMLLFLNLLHRCEGRLHFVEDDLMHFLPGIASTLERDRLLTSDASSSSSSSSEEEEILEEGNSQLPDGWENCGDDDDLFHLRLFTITPNPPKRASLLSVRVAGHLDETLTTGLVNYTVRFGMIPIVKDSLELCEALKMEPKIPQCPLKSGDWDVTHEVVLPAEVPFGKYSIEAAGWNKAGKRIFCVKGTTTIGLFKVQHQRIK